METGVRESLQPAVVFQNGVVVVVFPHSLSLSLSHSHSLSLSNIRQNWTFSDKGASKISLA